MLKTKPKPHPAALFFKQGIKKFVTNGSLFPSSKYLSEKILKHVRMKEKVFIVELGAGTGVFTNKILSKMPKSGKLVVFEINPILADYLRRRIIDPRITIIEADAVEIVNRLKNLNLRKPDYIISGIPIGNMTRPARRSLLLAVREALADNGLFLQFQYFLVSLIPINKIFETKIIGYEYRNLPPAFIYGCRKKITY